ncbi:hypothetical protein [Methylobacter sp. S3L5C]|uniref:hypothetical protein n=1 Tax=Methylobacter sp. S3L5C TaxID=2839024 RepID=UPI001FAC42EF|nr:hypothetical protein [Methylobacter sp. S3L5C]UOA09389.1 hypothetical protein KKZ03_03515 [Methylobacter sp. S3L5C]
MITQLIDLQQLICILDECNIIQTKRYDINTLIHIIQHSYFGFATIIEEAIGGGTLVYEQDEQSVNTLKPDNACTPVAHTLKPTELTKYFHRRCKSGLASRGG